MASPIKTNPKHSRQRVLENAVGSFVRAVGRHTGSALRTSSVKVQEAAMATGYMLSIAGGASVEGAKRVGSGVQEAAMTTGHMLSVAGDASVEGAKRVGSGVASATRSLFNGTKRVVLTTVSLPKNTLKGVGASLSEGAIERTTQSLTAKPHPLLERAYLLLEDLRNQLYSEGPLTEEAFLLIQETTSRLCDTLTQSSELRQYVFPKGLRKEDKKALSALGQSLALLNEWTNETLLGIEVCNGVEEGLLGLQYHYTPGLLPATLGHVDCVAARVLGRASKTADEVLGQATVLPANMARAMVGLSPQAPSRLPREGDPRPQGVLPSTVQTAATYAEAGIKKAIALGFVKDSESLRKIQERLKGMIESKDWDAIKDEMRGAVSLFQEDGLEPFDLETDPASLFLPQIRTLDPQPAKSPRPAASVPPTTLQKSSVPQTTTQESPVPPTTPLKSFEALATKEKDLLVDNLASFLTLSYVCEKICKLKPNADGYRALLSQHRDLTSKQLLEDDLKQALFASLKNQSYWVQFKARISYFFLNNIIKYYTKKAATVYFDKLLSKIKEGKQDHFESLKASLVENSHEYLAILNGAYSNVRDSTGPNLPLNTMLKNALLSSEAKLKSNPNDLYRAVFADMLKQTLGKRFGAFVGFFLKWIINPEKLVLSLIDSASESIKDKRGYSHSIHGIILEQLDDVWRSLRNPNSAKTPTETALLSRRKTAELSALITELLEVLGKSKSQTKDELKSSSRGLVDTVNHTMDNLAIHNVIETMAVMLSTLTQSILQEDKLQELVYKLTQSTNETFNTQEEIAEESKKRVEDAMVLRNKRILNFIIEGAIQEKLSNKEDRAGQFITSLRRNSSLFVGEITDLFTLYKKEKSQPAYRGTILEKIKKETLFYLNQCETANEKILEAGFSDEEFSRVMKHYAHVARQIAEVTCAIQEGNLEAIEQMVPHLCFSPTAVEKAEDFVTQLAYGRAKERVDGLLKLITDPLTLRFGVLHHLLLIPYLQKK